MLFNSEGVVTGAFLSKSPIAPFQDLEISQCNIKHVVAAPVHVVSLRTADNKVTTGLQGEKWNVFEFSDGNKYVGTPVSDLLILLAKLSTPGKAALPELVALREKTGGYKKTFSINSDLVDFASGKVQLKKLIKGGLKCNLDFMGHVHKGVIGLFLQGGTNVRVTDVSIDGVSNQGKAEFISECKASDPMFKSYGGVDARGVAVVASSNVSFTRLTVNDVSSKDGAASGIDVFKGSKDVCMIKVNVRKVAGKNISGGTFNRC